MTSYTTRTNAHETVVSAFVGVKRKLKTGKGEKQKKQKRRSVYAS